MDKPVLLSPIHTEPNRVASNKAAMELATRLRDSDQDTDRDYLLFQLDEAADMLEHLVSLSKPRPRA